MESTIEKVGDSAKSLFKGKNKMIWVIGAVGVGAFALFLRSKSQSGGGGVVLSSYPQAPQGGGSSSGGVSSDDLAQVAEGFAGVIEDFRKDVLEMQKDYQAQIADVQSNFADLISDQYEEIDDIRSDYDTKLSSGLSEIAKLQAEKTSAQTGGGGTDTEPKQHTKTPAAPAKTTQNNQVTYLEDVKSQAKASGNTGLEKWANQAKYLENLKTTGNDGQKKWAEAELKKMYGK